MNMEGRGFSGSLNYRFGYQGSEKDNEVNSSNGTSYTTEFRQLDTRLGRWFSSDPVFQPWQSSYTSMDNNPVNLTDVRGLATNDGGKPNIFRRAWNTLTNKTSRGQQKKRVGAEANDKEPSSPNKLKQFANWLDKHLNSEQNFNYSNNFQLASHNQLSQKTISKIESQNSTPTPYDRSKLGSVDYYKFRYDDFIKRNPGVKAPDYYLEYGGKYIQRFTDETNDLLTYQGKIWLKEVRRNLQVAIENELKSNPTIELKNGGKDFKEFAFNSHVNAYWNKNGSVQLYTLHTVDLVAIVLTPNFEDLISDEGIKQAIDMMGLLSDYWINNPMVGLERGYELLKNEKKITAMVMAKALREGVDPDKVMRILDKLLKNIPTL